MRLRSGTSSPAVVGILLLLGATAPAGAVTLGFDCISNNLAGDCAIGEAQMTVDVTDPGGGKIDFTFKNTGIALSSIADVYWDDGTLLAIFSITDTPGLVEFSSPATPANLPAANNASPPFATTAGFSADSDSPVQPMGVNPGEQLIVTYTLIGGQTFADAITALTNGSLRVGIHVQGYSSGGSESLVNNPVPEPGSLALVDLGEIPLTLRPGLHICQLIVETVEGRTDAQRRLAVPGSAAPDQRAVAG